MNIIQAALDYIEQQKCELDELVAIGEEQHAETDELSELELARYYELEVEDFTKLAELMGPTNYQDLMEHLEANFPVTVDELEESGWEKHKHLSDYYCNDFYPDNLDSTNWWYHYGIIDSPGWWF